MARHRIGRRILCTKTFDRLSAAPRGIGCWVVSASDRPNIWLGLCWPYIRAISCKNAFSVRFWSDARARSSLVLSADLSSRSIDHHRISAYFSGQTLGRSLWFPWELSTDDPKGCLQTKCKRSDEKSQEKSYRASDRVHFVCKESHYRLSGSSPWNHRGTGSWVVSVADRPDVWLGLDSIFTPVSTNVILHVNI